MSSFTASIGSFRYAGMPASLFQDIHISLQAGDCLLISGSGGCGKTSLCYCLANVIPGFLSHGELKGSVSVNDAIITGLPLARSAQFVGLLLQAPERQLCHLSVAEDITFGPENLGHSRGRIQGILRDVTRLLTLEPLLTRSPHTLSSGEAQRGALAATLALDPPVLVFDQPMAHFDAHTRRTFYQLVARLCREEGKIVIIAKGHNPARGARHHALIAGVSPSEVE
jgi:energy-coupling factor transporter ATP-binding protein EcfA2